jgi:hypothetical protein
VAAFAEHVGSPAGRVGSFVGRAGLAVGRAAGYAVIVRVWVVQIGMRRGHTGSSVVVGRLSAGRLGPRGHPVGVSGEHARSPGERAGSPGDRVDLSGERVGSSGVNVGSPDAGGAMRRARAARTSGRADLRRPCRMALVAVVGDDGAAFGRESVRYGIPTDWEAA